MAACPSAAPQHTHLFCISQRLCPRPALHLSNHALRAAGRKRNDERGLAAVPGWLCLARAAMRGRPARGRVAQGCMCTCTRAAQQWATHHNVCTHPRITTPHRTPSQPLTHPTQLSRTPISSAPSPKNRFPRTPISNPPRPSPDVQHIVSQPVVPLGQHPRELHHKHALSRHTGHAVLLPVARCRLCDALPALHQGQGSRQAEVLVTKDLQCLGVSRTAGRHAAFYQRAAAGPLFACADSQGTEARGRWPAYLQNI